jgi:hypothetical protein
LDAEARVEPIVVSPVIGSDTLLLDVVGCTDVFPGGGLLGVFTGTARLFVIVLFEIFARPSLPLDTDRSLVFGTVIIILHPFLMADHRNRNRFRYQ